MSASQGATQGHSPALLGASNERGEVAAASRTATQPVDSGKPKEDHVRYWIIFSRDVLDRDDISPHIVINMLLVV